MEEPTASQTIRRMLNGYGVAQALYVAAKLKLADSLTTGPRTADDMAVLTQTHARSLYRLLRTLASVGVFAEDDRGRFGLTPLAECLRSDVAGSQWAMAVTNGELFYRAWGELLHCVRTGAAGFEKVYGLPTFDYLARHAEQGELFDQTMEAVHGRETAAMLDAYDFAGVRVLADVGGGNGSVLSGVLRHYSEMNGILFDLPDVVVRARANIERAGLTARCRLVGGSFFESAPTGADAYLLRHIIHDWDDEKSTRILQNVHRSMRPDARLLVVESVILPGNEASIGKLLDLAMLVIPGGQERTEHEYRRLYEASGFSLTRIVPTNAEVCVIEGRKVAA